MYRKGIGGRLIASNLAKITYTLILKLKATIVFFFHCFLLVSDNISTINRHVDITKPKRSKVIVYRMQITQAIKIVFALFFVLESIFFTLLIDLFVFAKSLLAKSIIPKNIITIDSITGKYMGSNGEPIVALGSL